MVGSSATWLGFLSWVFICQAYWLHLAHLCLGRGCWVHYHNILLEPIFLQKLLPFSKFSLIRLVPVLCLDLTLQFSSLIPHTGNVQVLTSSCGDSRFPSVLRSADVSDSRAHVLEVACQGLSCGPATYQLISVVTLETSSASPCSLFHISKMRKKTWLLPHWVAVNIQWVISLYFLYLEWCLVHSKSWTKC